MKSEDNDVILARIDERTLQIMKEIEELKKTVAHVRKYYATKEQLDREIRSLKDLVKPDNKLKMYIIMAVVFGLISALMRVILK